jgi:dihydrofolate reductase
MKLIAAADKNWGIGKNNQLLVSIPEDMKFFRSTTMNGVVVMGRRTLDSFPGGRPLPRRVNIVLTAQRNFSREGVIVVHSLEELDRVLARYDSDSIYIIGGESVYRQLKDRCDTAYVTRIDYAYDADAWFPDLDADPDWEVTAVSEEQIYFDLIYHFCTYKRKEKEAGSHE